MSKMNKVKLSKGLLQMKFMMKTKEKVEKEEDDAEGRSVGQSHVVNLHLTTFIDFQGSIFQ
jgi:M-phase phosphoprotein-6